MAHVVDGCAPCYRMKQGSVVSIPRGACRAAIIMAAVLHQDDQCSTYFFSYRASSKKRQISRGTSRKQCFPA